MNDSLRSALKQLRLSGLLESLEVRLQEAAGNSLNHAEFLELVLQDELVVRGDRQLQRRVKAAQFRELKTLDEFDWSFNPSIKKKQIYDLATCRFIREARDVLAAWARRASARAFWSRPSATRRSRRASWCCTARSSTWSATSCTTRRLGGEDKVLARYLKPDLLHHRRHGHEATAQALRRIPVRDHHAPLRDALDDDDQQPAAGGLGQADRRRAQRHGHPRPLPAPRRDHVDHRQELPPAAPGRQGQGGVPEESKPANAPPARSAVGRVQNQPMRPRLGDG